MKKFCVVWLLIALLGLVAGCTKPQTEPTQTEKPINAGAFYASAKKATESAENLMLDYTLEETRTVGENTFTKQVTGRASYQGYAQDGMQAKVEETLDFGYYRCSYGEFYYGDKAYATVNDSYFWANQSPEAFVSRQIPPALLTPALYDTITYGENADMILFSGPRYLEAWVGEGQLLEASGQAEFNNHGQLLQTTYEAKYRKGTAEYSLSVTVRVSVPEQMDLGGIQDTQGRIGVWLSDLDTPCRLVQVVADVYCAQSVTCQLTETITSEAVPLSYERNSHISFLGRGNSLTAAVLNDSKLSNNRGVITESSQRERFENQIYQVSVNGSDPVQNGSVTADSMRQYCEDTVLSGLLAVKYLQDASVQTEGNLLRLELGGSTAFREMMTLHLKDVLQVDLDVLAESAENHKAGGYLTVDLQTGLPVAMGMYMEKSHTIDGVTYGLNYRLEETLTFS